MKEGGLEETSRRDVTSAAGRQDGRRKAGMCHAARRREGERKRKILSHNMSVIVSDAQAAES